MGGGREEERREGGGEEGGGRWEEKVNRIHSRRCTMYLNDSRFNPNSLQVVAQHWELRLKQGLKHTAQTKYPLKSNIDLGSP